jgi:hypothetical protein
MIQGRFARIVNTEWRILNDEGGKLVMTGDICRSEFKIQYSVFTIARRGPVAPLNPEF